MTQKHNYLTFSERIPLPWSNESDLLDIKINKKSNLRKEYIRDFSLSNQECNSFSNDLNDSDDSTSKDTSDEDWIVSDQDKKVVF